MLFYRAGLQLSPKTLKDAAAVIRAAGAGCFVSHRRQQLSGPTRSTPRRGILGRTARRGECQA